MEAGLAWPSQATRRSGKVAKVLTWSLPPLSTGSALTAVEAKHCTHATGTSFGICGDSDSIAGPTLWAWTLLNGTLTRI